MFRPAAAALVPLLMIPLLAGCLEPGEAEPAAGTLAPGDVPIAHATRHSWSSDETGDLGARLTFDLAAPTECRIETGAAHRSHGIMQRATLIRHDEAIIGWGAGGSRTVWARADGIADTRDAVSSGGYVATGDRYRTTLDAGTLEITVVGIDLEPWDNDITQGHAIVASLDCVAPVSLVRVMNATDIILFDETGPAGGASASAIVTGASTGGSITREIAAETVDAYLLSYGQVAGQVTFTHPHGSVTHVVPLDSRPLHVASGEGGRWGAKVDAAASARFSAFIGVIAGFDDAGPDPLATQG